MCYPKPGPRCSNHAAAELKKKEARLLAALGTSEALQAFEEKVEAKKQFNLTPAGQKELRNEIEAETDQTKKAELQAALDKAKTARAEAIAAAKATDVGDVKHSEVKPATSKPKLPSSPLPESSICYSPVSKRYDRYFYPGSAIGNTQEEQRESEEALISPYYLEYEYVSSRSWDGCDCGENDYHRCGVIDAIGFATPVTPEDFARAVFRIGGTDPVPDELVKPFEDCDLEANLELITTNGYYGEEALGIEMSSVLKAKVEAVTLSIPNATDPEGAYEYSRQEGVATPGLRPVEAIKETVTAKKLPAVVEAAVAKASKSQYEQVRISHIDFSSFDLASVDGYDYSGQKNTKAVTGGLLVKTGPKQYHLVGGADRFKAVQALGRVNWGFQVLND